MRWHDRCALHVWRAARQRRAIVALVVYAVAQACGWSEIVGGLIAWGALVIFVTRSLIVQALRGWLRQVIARRARGWTARRTIARWFPRAWASNG